ncbi:MAG TPA: tyrosine-type recombinase/integrase [Chitinophagaceae bacterium]|nr:tyrosine-type recombinase/integrase [Chitinophagaceae bacterium]
MKKSLQSFFDYLKFEKRYSSHTLTAYRSDLEGFMDFVQREFGEVQLSEISHSIVRTWLAVLRDEGLDTKSIRRKLSSLKSFFKHMLRMGVLETSPMAQVITPKAGKKLPVFMKEEDTAQVSETVTSSSDDWKSLNMQMLINIFYATGMRLSELVNLKEKQIDFSRGHIRVLGKGNKERIIPVSQDVLQQIRRYKDLKRKEFGSGSVEYFLVTEKGRKLYPKYAYLLVKKALSEVTTLEKKSPHVLRHTFATHILNNGANLNAVKELLGHSSLAATQVYTHNTIEKLKDVHKKAHPRS